MQGQRNEFGLTDKQERFAQAVVACATLTEAYRRVYTVAKQKTATIQTNAKALAKRKPVATRIETIRADLAAVGQSIPPSGEPPQSLALATFVDLKRRMDTTAVLFVDELEEYARSRHHDDKEYRVSREAYVKLRDVLFPRPKVAGVELPPGTKEAALFLKLRGSEPGSLT